MKISIDCIPCFYRQTAEACRLAGLNEKKTAYIINKTAKLISRPFGNSTPPELAGKIHALIKKESGVEDYYASAKKLSNKLALGVYAECKKKVKQSSNPLLTAAELAIAGNIIDFGIKNSINPKEEINKILSKKFFFLHHKKYSVFNKFSAFIKNSGSIMILADNAGETVFDRILIEEIKNLYPQKIIYYAVKSKPILNDALYADAVKCGIDKSAAVLSSGSVIPGTVLKKCSPPFRKIYKTCAMVISKGQGNFESFTDPHKNIFYLFMAKCRPVASAVKCPLKSINLLFSAGV